MGFIVIPGASKVEHVRDNLNILWERIGGIDYGKTNLSLRLSF